MSLVRTWISIVLTLNIDPILLSHHCFVEGISVQRTPISDKKYEQVIAERYLFTPFADECTAWTVLNNVSNAWQVVALPEYHFRAAEGVWLLIQASTQPPARNTLQMAWMSLFANGTLLALSDIDVNSKASLLVVSQSISRRMLYTAALISPDDIQLILCDQFIATSCKVTRSISFPAVLTRATAIRAGVFIEDFGVAGWLYIATDSGLHGLDLSTFTVMSFINGINVSVSSLAWSSKRQAVFVGTEKKLWICSYGSKNEGWRFEYVTSIIDAPITSLVYNNVQDKLWIGQSTGITLASPIIMSTGRLHWYFSRLAGQISNPGSDIGHLPFANITALSVSHSKSSPDGRVWLGAMRGVMRFDPNTTDRNAWRVFNSARYIPNRDAVAEVSSLAVLSPISSASVELGTTAVAVTSKGLTVLRFEMWTLKQKAEHFQAFFNRRHRHEKYGLVSSCYMSSWGDSRTCIKRADENDGLWTSMYLSSQIFRYQVTQDVTVKASA
ncbi:unnamed protein product, partial [Adineta ricciae]